MYLSDMLLQPFDPKRPDDEPQLQGSKPPAQSYLPVLKCRMSYNYYKCTTAMNRSAKSQTRPNAADLL